MQNFANFAPKSIESDLSTPKKIILETGGSRIGEMGGNGANFSVDIAMDPNISSVGADQLSNNYSHY